MTTVIHWLDEAESTNRVARDDVFVHGDVVATANQTAGRGRMDRTWSMAPSAGVAMTIVVSRAAIGSPRYLSRLPLVVAVALRRTLATFDGVTEATVKWPNDVQMGGRKVAGILVETLDDDRLGVGVGVNVTAAPDGLPSDSVTSLVAEGFTGTSEEFVSRFANAVLAMAGELDLDTTLVSIRDALDTIGRDVRLELPDGRAVSGRATGIGPTGSLLVHTAAGDEEFVAGDVTHLRLSGDGSVR